MCLSRVNYNELFPSGFILMKKQDVKEAKAKRKVFICLLIGEFFVGGFTDNERWKNIFNTVKLSLSLRSSSVLQQ